MPAELDGLLWLLLLLGPLILFQRGLHHEIQGVLLLLTRRPQISLVLYSLLLFPGVLLHESSHYIMALLLGVHTGHFSLLPRPLDDGRLQLGFVETASVDWVRDALIGVAPLLAGGAFVAYAGLTRLGLAALGEQFVSGGLESVWTAVPDLFAQPDFWLWFYLTLAVSSTMLPSASDRRAWIPVGLVLGALLAVGLLAGAGPWLMMHLATPINQGLKAVAIVFGISFSIHAILFLPLWITRLLLERIFGLRVA